MGGMCVRVYAVRRDVLTANVCLLNSSPYQKSSTWPCLALYFYYRMRDIGIAVEKENQSLNHLHSTPSLPVLQAQHGDATVSRYRTCYFSTSFVPNVRDVSTRRTSLPSTPLSSPPPVILQRSVCIYHRRILAHPLLTYL